MASTASFCAFSTAIPTGSFPSTIRCTMSGMTWRASIASHLWLNGCASLSLVGEKPNSIGSMRVMTMSGCFWIHSCWRIIGTTEARVGTTCAMTGCSSMNICCGSSMYFT